MRSRANIVKLAGRCIRVCAILLLILLVATESADAQRGKKSGSRKGKTTAVQKKKSAKSTKSAKSAKSSKGKKDRRAASTRSTSKKAKKESQQAAKRRSVSTPERSAAGAPKQPAQNRSVTSRQQRAAQTLPVTELEEGPADLAQQTLQGKPNSSLASSKRPAPGIQTLNSDQIRAINAGPREIETLPLRGYPEAERPQAYTQPFYAEGSLGLYMTGSLRAGYLGSSWPYDYSVQVGAMGTNGFIDNAARSSFSGGARGGYVIGDSYGIFSGGHMGAEVDYLSENYRRYAIPEAPERSRSRWSLAMTGQNTYNGTSFELKGLYRQLSLADSGTIRENGFEGNGKVRTQWGGLTVGGEADMRLTWLAGNSIGFGRFDAYAKYSTSFFSVRAGGNFGAGANSDGTTATRLAPVAEISLFPVYGITLSAGITGGLSQSTLNGLSTLNQYVVADPLIHHEAEKIGYRAGLRFDPWQSFGLHVAGARGSYDDYAYFAEVPGGLFAPIYGEATVTKVTGDFYLELGARDMIAAQATFVESTLDSGGAHVPYVPKWTAELMYAKRLADLPITLTATARYIGERSTPADGLLGDALLLGLKGRYAINSHFDATLELSNLANQRYELWPGYRERGFFGAVGLGVKY